jgi:Glycosyltransferase family 10 (fucosyltransferase) C-term
MCDSIEDMKIKSVPICLQASKGIGVTMKLIRITKDWDWPDLLRQTPGGKGIWDGIQFTTDEVDVCDALLLLNNRMKKAVSTHCPKGYVWALMQEPYVKGFTDWMVEGHDAFDRVYTNFLPSNEPKYIKSHPALPWHVNRTFDELTTCDIPGKKRSLSWVVGNCRDLPGHVKRYAFLRSIQSEKNLDIDLFGRAVCYIEDKWDGLADYRYSIAAENTVWPDYWTEKIADCFLSWTIPFYYGCTNLEEYFPADSFIRIDIENPAQAIETIKREVLSSSWERRLPALEEARRRVLHEYQIFPHLAKLYHEETAPQGERSLAVVPRYQRSLKTSLHRMTGKLLKSLLQMKGFS